MRLQLSLSLAMAAALAAAGSARAAEYYVATTGSDSNAGTMAAPFATLQKGVNTAAAGDTVWIRGGTYKITTPASSSAGVNFTKSGTSDTNRIKYWAYPGEVPVFDFSGLVMSTSGYTNGFVRDAATTCTSRGSRSLNVPMNTSPTTASRSTAAANDIFEPLNMHHNAGNGIFIGNKSGGGHLVLNWTRTTTTIRIRTRAWDRTPTASAFTTRRRAPARSFAAAAPGGTPTTATI